MERDRPWGRILRGACVVAALASAVAHAQEASPPSEPDAPPAEAKPLGDGLTADMKLEDLVRQDVVVPALSQVVETVDRQVSTVGRTPAAVFVITPEMIKRSGARYIPEVLRMAPGVSVAKIDSSTWAITARGFQGRFANKLLVQIDGRVVYSPTMFGGVYWDVQVLPLEDVERIEVIRGPGTTAWGSNAVNGVINIITKKASDTQGALINSGGGNQEQDFNTVRYGGTSGDVSWRAWGMQFDRNKGWSPNDIQDQWRQQRGGFRADWTPSDEDTVTLQGDIYNGYEGQQFTNTIPAPPFTITVNDETHVSGGDVLLRYNRVLDDETSWQFLAYYDKMRRNFSPFAFTQDTYNLDLQYQFSPWEDHQFISGVNYRRVQDFTRGGFSFSLIPPAFATQWASVFAQDTMTLQEDFMYFTLGVRLEYNTFGKFQPEPTARLLILPSERQSLWFAVSRAARMPARSEADLSENFHGGGITFFNLLGDQGIIAEDLMAYEIGYRAAPTDYFTWDIAAYINDYHNLIGLGNPGTPTLWPPGTYFNNPVPIITIPVPYANNTRAMSAGVELTATCKLTEIWEITGNYSVFEVSAQSSEVFDIVVPLIEGGTPHNQVYLRSSWDWGSNVQFDLIGRYVDKITYFDIPKYFEMDAVLSWRAAPNLEFSLVGQNLLQPHHLEYEDIQMGMHSTEVVRGVYGAMTFSH
jgi:iron complex outermembrane receptor protein